MALLEDIGQALELPHPYVHEKNTCLVLLHDWQKVVQDIVSYIVHIYPLGYYRTPNNIVIYVFECSMRSKENAFQCTRWKIYRRYRQFQNYVSHASTLLSSMVIPRLSQATMKLFEAKEPKDRLVELHSWLRGVIESTQNYSQYQPSFQCNSITQGFSLADRTTFPAILLTSFLFAGANQPFPHTFHGMPKFAFAKEEVNICLKEAPSFPSRVRSSMDINSGIGLRLIAAKEKSSGEFYGARVSGFLRDASALDAQLTLVQIGSRLVQINDEDVSKQSFNTILMRLQNVGLPLRLRFLYDPQLQQRQRKEVPVSTHRKKSVSVNEIQENNQSEVEEDEDEEYSALQRRRNSDGYSALGQTRAIYTSSAQNINTNGNQIENGSVSSFATTNGSSFTSVTGPTEIVSRRSGADKRSYSADSRLPAQTTMGLFSSVFSDLFGMKQRAETSRDNIFSNQVDNVESWDDMGGNFTDISSRGFFSPLSNALLYDLHMQKKREEELGAVAALASHEVVLPTIEEENTWRKLEKRKAQGIWSTTMGPMGFCFGASQVRGVDTAMLEAPPGFFSSASRRLYLEQEQNLGKGCILISINKESTFGLSFPEVMHKLSQASQPTALTFRWYDDFSPFLETEGLEEDGEIEQESEAFESPLECISEAQVQLCDQLQLALIENATIRNEIVQLQDTIRQERQQNDELMQVKNGLSANLDDANGEISRLAVELQQKEDDLLKANETIAALQKQVSQMEKEYKKMAKSTREAAMKRIAEQEAQLVQESNKSIQQVKTQAEERLKRELAALREEMQKEHDEYLQKVAEEHSEEVDSLFQQVAVWRHQVEVLTEAEKRNYAPMINKDYHRNRFGHGLTKNASSNNIGSTTKTEQNGNTNKRGQLLSSKSLNHITTINEVSGNEPSKQQVDLGQHSKITWREPPQSYAKPDMNVAKPNQMNNNQQPGASIWDRVVSLI